MWLVLFLLVFGLSFGECILCDNSCGDWSCISNCSNATFDKPRCFVDVNGNGMVDSCSELLECTNGVCPADPNKSCGRSLSEAMIECEGGGRYDVNIGKCVANSTCTCPEGYTFDGEQCVAEPVRTDSGQFVCPDGTGTSSELCTKPAQCSCPEGYTFDGTQCVKDVQAVAIVVEEEEEEQVQDGNIGNCTPRIFSGTDRRCRSGGLTILGASCCGISGLFSGLCSKSEKELKKMRQAGICREIGEYCSKKWKIGFAKICVEKKRTYCCFNSELAKIINECGRPQIGKSWGEPKSPNCAGFTIEEFANIDLSRAECLRMIEAWAESFAGSASSNVLEIKSRAVNSIQNWLNDVSK